MKEYMSHFSAAYHWEIKKLDNLFTRANLDKSRIGKIDDITVTSQNMRYQKKDRITHLCEKELPRGAVVKCGEKYVASPELVFLELADYLDLHRLVFLGLQMCMHPPGKESQAITTKRKLEAFLKKTPGHRGHRKAEIAVKYVANGSNSIMESLVFMMLTLPHSYGGFGLTDIQLNPEILLDKKYSRKSYQRRYYVDFYFPKSKLAIEYDSDKYHNEEEARSKDRVRTTTLNNLGIDVMSLDKRQLYSKEKFDDFVLNLATRLGKRIRIRTKKFDTAHRELRKLLPTLTE